jgi:ketopantoate reductase
MSDLGIAVLGAGGVGGLLAAVLTRSGDRVTVLSGGLSAQRLTARGLRVRSSRFGDFTVPVSVSPALEQEVEVCIVAVKARDLSAAVGRVPAAKLGHALILPLLNGVECAVRRIRSLSSEFSISSVSEGRSVSDEVSETPGVSPPFGVMSVAGVCYGPAPVARRVWAGGGDRGGRSSGL